MKTHAQEDMNEDTLTLKNSRIRQIIYHIRRLMQAGEQYTKELNRTYQVSTPQLHCLLVLLETGPLPPSHIARHILVKSSTVTGIIDRLEQKSLVRRVRSDADRRKINIELTEEGSRLASGAPLPLPRKILTGLRNLPAQEVEKIVDCLDLLTRMLDEAELNAE